MRDGDYDIRYVPRAPIPPIYSLLISYHIDPLYCDRFCHPNEYRKGT